MATNMDGPIRMALEGGFTAQLDWQSQFPTPIWIFGFSWEVEIADEVIEQYQPCLTVGGVNPDNLIFEGIYIYDLPEPLDLIDRANYTSWLPTRQRREAALTAPAASSPQTPPESQPPAPPASAGKESPHHGIDDAPSS